MLAGTIVIGTVGYRFLTKGHYDWVTCIYMTVITLSTVGFGEVIDISQFAFARGFTIMLIMFGMGIVLYSVGTFTAIMVETDMFDVLKRRKMNKRIEHLRNHFIVCGAGATGICIIEELWKTGVDFVVIELDDQRIEALNRFDDLLCIKGDATEDEVLMRAGIERAHALAATLSSEKDNLYLTLTARQLSPSARIVARGLDDSVNQKLRKAGADATVSPTFIGGLRMASELIRPSVVSFLDTMLRDTTGAIRFEELPITPESSFINQTIKATHLRDSNLLVVALKESGSQQFIYNPPADTTLTDGMTLIVLGESTQINKLR
jgi:voltage-gated potassium channel